MANNSALMAHIEKTRKAEALRHVEHFHADNTLATYDGVNPKHAALLAELAMETESERLEALELSKGRVQQKY